MRICLIGDFRSNLDEGYTNIAHNLVTELARRHDIIKLNPRRPLSAAFWRSIMKERPHVIHYLTAPSMLSFWILKALALYWRGSKTMMSALHPDGFALQGKGAFKKMISRLRPDLILTHSGEMEKMLVNFGCKTAFLPNGVDVERFRPYPSPPKQQLREKYGIDRNKFIILHVGHLKRDRNVQILKQMQDESRQVLIVASTFRGGGDEKLHRELKESGCMVWRGYIPNIEEVYALADCYLFPTLGSGSLLLPLSVMEAMACNLPVISTRFGALPALFQEGDGLFFAQKEEDFLLSLDRIQRGGVKVSTRQKVLPYAWGNVAEELERIYATVVSEGKD